MTVYQLFELTNYISGRHPQGTAITPQRFNALLSQCSLEYYDSLWRELVSATLIQGKFESLMSRTPLLPFKQTTPLTMDEYGVADLPDDYSDYLSVVTRYEATDNYSVLPVRGRFVKIVNDDTFRRYQESVMRRRNRPFGRIITGQLHVVPTDISNVYLDYLVLPVSPIMDICSKSSNPSAVVNMPVGSYIAKNDSNTDTLYDSSGTVLENAVLKSGITTYPYQSQTVELQWNERDHMHLLYRVLVKTGLNLAEKDVLQYATAKTQTT